MIHLYLFVRNNLSNNLIMITSSILQSIILQISNLKSLNVNISQVQSAAMND